MTRKSLMAVLLMLIMVVACNKEAHHDHDHDHDHAHQAAPAASDHTDHEGHHEDEGHDHGPEHEETHGALGGHVHGEVHLALAVDGNTIALELTAPAESFLGFEKQPSTEAEKEQWTIFESNWNSTPENFFRADSTLGCTPAASKVSLEIEDTHAEIRAERTYTCAKSPNQTFFEVRFQEKYPKVKKIKMEVLPDGKASYVKDVEITSEQSGSIKLSL